MKAPSPALPGPLALLAWLSPSFPIGSFAYSHGLEWAFEAQDIADAATLQEWLADLVAHGSLRNDLILLSVAHRALNHDHELLIHTAELSVALSPTRERHLETIQQGNAFLNTIAAAWPCAAVDRFRSNWPGDIGLPVAVAVAAGGHGIDSCAVLEAFALSSISNLVSAAVRLGIIAQTEGQRVIADLVPKLKAVAEWAEEASLDDLGGCAFRSDVASALHETQYARLFRS